MHSNSILDSGSSGLLPPLLDIFNVSSSLFIYLFIFYKSKRLKTLTKFSSVEGSIFFSIFLFFFFQLLFYQKQFIISFSKNANNEWNAHCTWCVCVCVCFLNALQFLFIYYFLVITINYLSSRGENY
jgi:Mn2+/Fe2+ NRAMP family transporter